jgi:hypothetical protein
LLRGVKRVEAKADRDDYRFREKLAGHAEANAIGRRKWWLNFGRRDSLANKEQSPSPESPPRSGFGVFRGIDHPPDQKLIG